MTRKKKKASRLRRSLCVFLTFAAILVAASAGLFAWLHRSLPQIDGAIPVSGTTGDVEILRDPWGIPYIHAGTPEDAYFGLGFVHAQDRMFQMEQQRRLSQGRLSEILGPTTVGIDRFLRLLDLHRAARASVETLDPAARKALDAYASGVNAYMATQEGPLAPELALLLADAPDPWSAADTVAWLKVMALHLSGNWREEALRTAMTARLGPEMAASFFPQTPPAAAPAVADEARGGDSAAPVGLLRGLLPPGGLGSNNWVVDGRRTASGRPLLANDPHLGLSIPAAWYLARLEAPGLRVAGATLPGLPLVIVGANERLAWGVTNAGPDTQDLFIERLAPDDPGRYLTPEGTEAFVVREETVGVRFADDERVVMRETRHGPVLTGIRKEAGFPPSDSEVVALAWTMLRDDDRSVEAGLALHTARDWSDFVASGRNYAGPMQNIVYADRRGNIGLLSPAFVPIRKNGDGLLAAEGWTGEADWVGRIPYDALPRLLNPETGVIVTANDRPPIGDDYPYLLGHRWQPGYRAGRIREVLLDGDGHDLESFAALQRDTRSAFAAALLPTALDAEPRTDDGRRLQGSLREWDGDMAAELVAPTAFHAWYREFTRLIYEDDLGELFRDAWWFRPAFVLTLVETDPHGWCANAETGEDATCRDLAGMAFDRAAAFLAERFGDDAAAWVWGDVHALRLRHRLFGLVPALDRLTGVDKPLGGGRYTVATAGYVFNSDERVFETVHGPSLRAIVDMAEPVTGYFAVLPGQSGNPFSPYYDNMTDRWLANDPIAIPFDRDRIDAKHRLVLSAERS